MKKLLIQIIMILTLIFSFISFTYAFEVQWWHLQYRKQFGTESNRIAFAIFDDQGNYITENMVSSIELYDPDEVQVSLLSDDGGKILDFRKIESLSGSYDTFSSKWLYSNEFTTEYYYVANFLETLKIGIYRLVINFTDGQSSSFEKSFGGIVDLPVIESESFYFRKDNDENVILTWDVPDRTDFGSETSARAFLEMYNDDTYVGELIVKIPAHMGYIFVPVDIFQKFKTRLSEIGNNFKIGVHIRTNDNFNRSYSDFVTIEQAIIPKCDVSDDGKTGLEEAIHALQVVAGMKK